MQDMSLSQTAELGLSQTCQGVRVDLAREKGSEVGGNLGQAGSHLFVAHFLCVFLILQLC